MQRRDLLQRLLSGLSGPTLGPFLGPCLGLFLGQFGPAAAQASDADLARRYAAALARAHALRDAALRAGDQPYGAVVVDQQQRIVGEAQSAVVTLQDPDAHAERLALRNAQARLARSDLSGLVLVSSSRPCALCEAAAARAGIVRMVHGSGTDAGAPQVAAPAVVRAAWPLVEAAARGDLTAVRRLLDQGAPLDATDTNRRSALLAAVHGGFDAVAVLLVERGADINLQDSIDDSPFLLAGARGRTAVLRAMLLPPTGSAARPDYSKHNRYGGSALIPACHYGHVETVALLLQSSHIDIDQVNRLGWTALLEAVILGDGGPRHTEIVRLLLAHRADPNRADAQGITPLAHARQRGQGAVAALIAAAGGR